MQLSKLDTETIRSCVRSIPELATCTVYIFGSRARGDAVRSSDVDLLLIGATTIGLDIIGALRDVLEESLLPYQFDVVDAARLDEALRERMLASAICISR